MTDLILAATHHLLVLALIAMLASKLVLARTQPTPVLRLAGLDAGLGGAALLMLAAGVSRVVWGGKGWAFYEANPFFWAKMATFLAIGLLSIGPTRRFLAWKKALKADPGFRPDPAQARAVVRTARIELALAGLLMVFAAAMARWPF